MKKIIPYKEISISNKKYKALERQYKKYEKLFAILSIFFSIILAFVFYTVLIGISYIIINKLNNYRFLLISLYKTFMFIPSLFLGIIFSTFPLEFTNKILFKEKYDEYKLYSNYRSGINTRKLKPIAVIFIVLCFLSSILFIDTYTIFYEDEIGINSYLSISEKKIKYTNIKKIESYYTINAKSNEVSNLKYKITFKNYEIWNTEQGLRDPDESDEHIMKFMSIKSGIPIESIGELRNK